MPGISYNQNTFSQGSGGGGWGGSFGFGGFGGAGGYGGQQPVTSGTGSGGFGYGAGEQFNPNSALSQWQAGHQYAPFQFQEGGFNPNNPYGVNKYNPLTGEIFTGQQPGINISGQEYMSVDPMTGYKNINPGAMMAGLSGFGGGGGQVSIDPIDYQGYSGQYEGPGAWDPMQVSAGQVIDTDAVIESYRPLMEEEIGRGFADAGSRMGQSGFAMSTPYANELGQVERSALDDFTRTALGYKYGAAEAQAAREMEAQMANAASDLQMQTALSGQQHQGAMQNQLLDFYSQTGINDFNLSKAGLDLQSQLANQQAGLQDKQFMQSLMTQMLSGML